MILRTIVFLIFLTFVPLVAQAMIYDINISKNKIEKNSEFVGDEISVSGLMHGKHQIIVSVTGPNKSYQIAKKEPLFGLWLNRKLLTIPATFSFYQIYASDSLEKITDYDTLKILNLDLDYADYFPKETYDKDEMFKFYRAFKEYQQSIGQYSTTINPIEIIGNGIFRLKIKLFQNVPVGEYVIKIAEFDNGKITQIEYAEFNIEQSPFYANIDDYAHNNPLLYALTAILLALLVGGAAGYLFNGVKV